MRKSTILSVALSMGLGSALPSHAADENVDFGRPATAADVGPVVASSDGNTPSPLGATAVHTFSGGSGERSYKVEVSGEGNLVTMQWPAGVEHEFSEGYIACYGLFTVATYENKYASSGWGAATVTSTSPLTIVRTSTSGSLQLTQKFTADKTEQDFLITMTLQNISRTTLNNVSLERWFHGYIDGDPNHDYGFRDASSASIIDHHGVRLDALTNGTVSTHVGYLGMFPENSCGGLTADTPPPASPFNINVKVGYYFGNLSSGASKTVKFRYSRL